MNDGSISLKVMSVLYAVGTMLEKEGRKNPLVSLLSGSWDGILSYVSSLESELSSYRYEADSLRNKLDTLQREIAPLRTMLSKFYASPDMLANAYSHYESLYYKYNTAPPMGATVITNEEMVNVANLWFGGSKIMAIKAVRELPSMKLAGLKDVKDLLESLYP